MRVNGIIAEYNPFHNGHKYLLTESKRATAADYTIIVMSGNFVQRGGPAMINKYKRTRMALENGADLVLELPLPYATASAEYFAMGGVSLLDKLGVVTTLSFGSECGNLAALKRIAQIVTEEPPAYISLLRQNLKKGQAYPSARANALLEYDTGLQRDKGILTSPNNILGIEYLKALSKRKSQIVPHTILRAGAGYHDTDLKGIHCSATGIREAVLCQESTALPTEHMPKTALAILRECIQQGCLLRTNDFSSMLHYKLLTEYEKGFSEYLDVTPELSDRIRKNIFEYGSFQDFCDLLKTKDMTHTRISRSLLHIMLNIRSEDLECYQRLDYIPYARVLGFKREAAGLMNAIKKNGELPLLTKLADAGGILNENALKMLQADIFRNTIYESAAAIKSGRHMQNEYRTPIVII